MTTVISATSTNKKASLKAQSNGINYKTSALPIVEPVNIPHDYTLWQLSVDKYHAMTHAGILTEDDPVELLEGWLVYKMPKKPSHTTATRFTRHAFTQLIPIGWFVDSQEPITLEDSEPEPDVVVVRGHFEQYMENHPTPRDIALVVEISDATLQKDQGSKKRIYARAGIPIYWIVNLVDSQLEIYTNPSGPTANPTYADCQTYFLEDSVSLYLDGQEVGMLEVKGLFS